MPTPPALAYRRFATQQASAVGLVIALYDTLAGDLQRATVAMQTGNIEERCSQLKHGFAVLTQLNSLVDCESGGQAAVHLGRFYEHIRREMLGAQFTLDAAGLERASALVLDVRGAWQEVDARGSMPSRDDSPGGQGSSPRRPISCMA